MKLSSILGINARTKLYAYRYNTKRGKKIANSKAITARILKKHEIPHPEIFVKFKTVEGVENYDFKTLPRSFVIKPSRGLGGEGIVVVKKRVDSFWITSNRDKLTERDLKLHIQDILEGAYSMGNFPDVALIQEYVKRHKAFRRYAFRGTPDIRVIVFNKIPVMAMLRLPTRESGGRANLHQGAIAVGVDIATGITTYAFWKGKYIKFKPTKNDDDTGKKRKLHGIKIPNWNAILELAVSAQMVSGLGYLGVDIILHPERGPMILELNAQPGLQIQMANKAGLKRRLERVDELEVRDAEHGVKIGKALFGEKFLSNAKTEKSKTVSAWEKIVLYGNHKKKLRVWAKVDTGAWRTSIDETLAEKLGLLEANNILWTRKIRSASGTQERPIIYLSYRLAGERIRTMASISNRKHMRMPINIGRKDLTNVTFKTEKMESLPPMWYKEFHDKSN